MMLNIVASYAHDVFHDDPDTRFKETWYAHPNKELDNAATDVAKQILSTWRVPTMWVLRLRHGAIPRKQRIRWAKHVLDKIEPILAIYIATGEDAHASIAEGFETMANNELKALLKG